MRTIRRRLAALGGLALAVLVPLSLTVPANAVPLTTYSDSSVTANPLQLTDHGPAVSTVSVLPASVAGAPANLTFTASGGFSTHTFAVSPGTLDGYTLAIDPSTGILSFTPVPSATHSLTSAVSFTVTATDTLGAVGQDTVTLTPTFPPSTNVTAGQSPHQNMGDIFGLNNNVTGAVDFSVTPAPNPADSFSANNLPGGTTIATDGILTAISTIPGEYNEIPVLATDSQGAVAVEVVKLTVVGGVVRPTLPHLYGGHAVQINSVREWVYFVQGGAASCDYFTIVGPGGINGHHGWVPAHLGLNAAWYAGLDPGHGYTVYYTPVGTVNGSCAGGPTTPIPGTHWGYVYFVS